jgi:hypothetical protein
MATSLSTSTTKNTTPRGPRTDAGKTLELFFELLKKHNLTYDIRWRWEGGSTGRRGANRDGVLLLFRDGERVFREQYERSSMRWRDGDVELNRLTEGSNRYYAVVGAIEFMQQL